MSETALTLRPTAKTLGRLEVTEESLDKSFATQVLPSAVEQMLAEHCFTGPNAEIHDDCRVFWESLPDSERDYEFFCLGEKRTCINCGTVITALISVDGAQKLTRGRCPGCGEPVAELGLEQARWWEILAHAAGGIVATYNAKADEIFSGLVFRIADFMLRSGAEANTANNATGARDTARRIYLNLLESFPKATSWCSYASRWAVYGRLGASALGIALPLSTTAKCELMSVLEDAAIRKLGGQDVPQMADIWTGNSSQRERAKAMRKRLDATGAPEEPPSWERSVLPEREAQRISAYQFIGPGDDGAFLPFLLLKVDPEQFASIADRIDITLIEINAVQQQWLEETTGCGKPVT